MSDPEPFSSLVPPPADPPPTAPASRHLARSAGVVGAATMTSRVLGLVREQVLAYWFPPDAAQQPDATPPDAQVYDAKPVPPDASL